MRGGQTPVIPFPRPSSRTGTMGASGTSGARPAVEPQRRTGTGPSAPNSLSSPDKAPDVNDMEIPTFIRRQMD
jgi:hypothetical protein